MSIAKAVLIGGILIAATPQLIAEPQLNTPQDLVSDVEDYIDFLASLNHYSILEGAGSHGSLGVGLGIGASQHSAPSHSRLVDDQLRGREDFAQGTSRQSKSDIVVPRAYFHKGLPVPVDFGVSLAKIPNTNATTAGVYAQWTLYEAFAMPAIAIRGKYSRMMGLPSTEFNSASAEAVASYGFFKILTGYGSLGINRHVADIQTTGPSATTLTISEDPSSDVHYTRQNQTLALGLQAQIIPQFFTASVENRRLAGQTSWLAKVSVGL